VIALTWHEYRYVRRSFGDGRASPEVH